MSTAVPVVTLDRCQRCGTKIRNRRVLCPSCGYDLVLVAAQAQSQGETPQAPEPAGVDSPTAASASGPRRVVAAKAGVKLCGICMVSVAEEQLVDYSGQKVCPVCAENLKNKAMKKAAGGPPKA